MPYSRAPAWSLAVVAMFSLRDVPPSLQGGIPPDAFDPTSAGPLAKELADAAPYPTPGSESDKRLAEHVKSRFAAIDGATVSEQRHKEALIGFKGTEIKRVIAIDE